MPKDAHGRGCDRPHDRPLERRAAAADAEGTGGAASASLMMIHGYVTRLIEPDQIFFRPDDNFDLRNVDGKHKGK